ncbi:hypothetical protein [Ralstonia pseudosolanacearum]|uniref:hypothetical protein n=1 Tax=Ralstonia pseudosolanacearum TaxID=1310165 RepID=UPI003CEBB382
MVSTTPPKIDDLASFREAGYKAVSDAVDLIGSIDTTLEKIDHLMYVMQPFKTGRIGVKFVSSNGKFRPEARIFRQLRNLKWVSSYASHKGLRRRVKRAREFEANQELLKLLCDHVTTLIQLRMDTIKRLKHFGVSVNLAIRTRSKYMAETIALVDVMGDQLEARFDGDMEMDNE